MKDRSKNSENLWHWQSNKNCSNHRQNIDKENCRQHSLPTDTLNRDQWKHSERNYWKYYIANTFEEKGKQHTNAVCRLYNDRATQTKHLGNCDCYCLCRTHSKKLGNSFEFDCSQSSPNHPNCSYNSPN